MKHRKSIKYKNRFGDEKQSTSKFGKIKNLALLIGTLVAWSVAGAIGDAYSNGWEGLNGYFRGRDNFTMY